MSPLVKWCESLFMGLAVLTHVAAPVEGPHLPVVTKHPVGTTQSANGFLEYLPINYGAKGRAPLLIAWHGRGEIGPGTASSLEQLNNNGITKMLHEGKWDQTLPFVVLAPQHSGGGCPQADEIADFLHFAKSHYKIDEHQVYLTGLSCGARGIADYLAHYGGKELAATVLISGDLSPAWAKRECALANDVPMWIIHGDKDDIVPITGDQAVVDNIQTKCPRHKEIRFDSYRGVGHDAWTKGYASNHHDVYAWMLRHKIDVQRTATAAH